jgi:NADP-dependent aldehyde dehydrogenase
MRRTQERPVPIPFFAEMSSINPVFVLPSALENGAEALAKGLAKSATQGVGQFCTNPGVVVPLGDADAFARRFIEMMNETPAGTMANRNIASSYRLAVERRLLSERANTSSALDRPAENECSVKPIVFETDIAGWMHERSFRDEIFGPTTLIVHAEDKQHLMDFASSLEGNLTASIFGNSEELFEFSDLVSLLETKVGRIIWNDFPTGVEVCEAMVHGGPFPATSDGRSTSVGGRAILRFTKPICYQNFPDDALPAQLRTDNPHKICRLEDGAYQSGI